MTQRVTESPQWNLSCVLPPNPFLTKSSNLFDQLQVDAVACVMHLPALLIRVLFLLTLHFFQQQVAFAIHNTKLREAAEWAESRRIAELFPIDWNSESSESLRSNNEQHLTKTKAPFRTR
jgi:hypothetical protein